MKTNTRSRALTWIFSIVGLVVLVGALAGVKAAEIGAMIKAGKSFVPPPESVSTARVEAARWQATRPAVGTLVAVHGVTLGAELPGIVREISFQSGSFVRRGAVLVRQDVSTEEAQLAAATADASLARLSLERARSLREANANAQADLDAAEARAKQADATVAALQATIAKKTIRAPFDGRISIRQVELGQMLAPGAPIASLQSVSPIYGEFSLPQQALAELKIGEEVRMRSDIFPGETFSGRVTTVNSEVDPATRNIRVRATFQNPDGRLRAGMFVSLEVVAPEQRPVLLLPVTSILYAPYGDTVFVLEDQKDPAGKPALVARQRFVRLGERRGDLVAITSGLTAGETVVSSGAFKLRNGAAVVVKNDLAPAAQLDPKPVDP